MNGVPSPDLNAVTDFAEVVPSTITAKRFRGVLALRYEIALWDFDQSLGKS